jgi:hypothetical protein
LNGEGKEKRKDAGESHTGRRYVSYPVRVANQVARWQKPVQQSASLVHLHWPPEQLATDSAALPSVAMKLRDLRKAPFYPIVPFVPLAFLGGVLALELFTLARLRRLSTSVAALLDRQSELATT